ncbi:MAG: PEGA domain-containing protein [Spirochaetota bacterium]
MKLGKIALMATALLLVGAVGLFAQAGTFGDSGDDDGGGSRRVVNHRLTVRSNVRGADIYIDGVRRRQTAPATFTLRPDTYTIRVEARGYQPWQRRVDLDSDRTLAAELLPPTATILLQIPSEFLNDRVRDPWRQIDLYVDGRLRNESRVEVERGYHDVAIASGGLMIENELYFEAGRTYTLELIMRLGFFQSGR